MDGGILSHMIPFLLEYSMPSFAKNWAGKFRPTWHRLLLFLNPPLLVSLTLQICRPLSCSAPLPPPPTPAPTPNRVCFQGFFPHYGGVCLSSHSPSLLFPIGLLSLGFLWEIFLYLSQLALVLVWNRFPWRRFGEEIQLLFPLDPSTRKSVSEFSITGVSWCLIARLAEETESIALLLFCYDSGSRARNFPDCVPAV